jgi:CheY-like chemotaxis protein
MTVLTEDETIDVVGIAQNGIEAVELADSLRPDVILMDLKMPVMGGLEATRRIRNAGNGGWILILTGTDRGSKEAAAAGASAFLCKEHGVEELRRVLFGVASLAAVLGGSRS